MESEIYNTQAGFLISLLHFTAGVAFVGFIQGILLSLTQRRQMLIYFIYYRSFQSELNAGNIEASRHQLPIIRRLGIVNMVLGFCVVVVIGGSPYLA